MLLVRYSQIAPRCGNCSRRRWRPRKICQTDGASSLSRDWNLLLSLHRYSAFKTNVEKIKNGCYSILICYKRLILFAFISLLILFSSSTIFSQTGSTVVINEIVYDPDQIDTCEASTGEGVG